MIEKYTKYVPQEFDKTITCDICKKTFDASPYGKDIFEVQEFIHIRAAGGYGSVFGDGEKISCDICQHCLKEKLGEYINRSYGED